MSLPLPPISKHEESNSPMKNSHLDTSSLSEKQNATLANQQKSESGASTHRTSYYQTESSSNLKEDLQRLIGPNLLLSDPNIPKSTYDCYSSKTTTQPNSSGNGIQSGPQSRDFNGPLGKSYPPVGQKASTYDEGKPPLANIPWAAVTAMSEVQAYGHSKYGDFNNYRKGMEVTRNLSCAVRHIRDYLQGMDLDSESGKPHLAHAMCRLAFVLENIADGTAVDDRYKRNHNAK